MRKSIFEIASEKIDMKGDSERICGMLFDEKTLIRGVCPYSIMEFVDEYCFEKWKWRSHFIDVEDYLNSLDFLRIKEKATHDFDSFITLIEFSYNFWILTHKGFDTMNLTISWCGNYYHLKDVMDDILNKNNYVAHIDKENDCVLIIEDKAEVTAVAEILPSALAFDVIKYNHKSLEGEIETKKSILISMGAELEPKRKDLQSINKQLSEDIFFMLNNINIRHNNRSIADKTKYKEYVAKMNDTQLEKWYDELYQMMLLAFLQLDNIDRSANVKALKSKIVGGEC